MMSFFSLYTICAAYCYQTN